MSIKYKIALLFGILVTLFVMIVSVSVYFVSAEERLDRFGKRLKNRALTTGRFYAGSPDNSFAILRRMDTAAVASLYNKSIVVINSNNDSLSYSFCDIPGDTLRLTHDQIEQAKKDGELYFSYKDKKAVAVHQEGYGRKFLVAVAAADVDGAEYLFQLKKTLLGALLLAAGFSFLAGLIFARSIIAPIKRITREVNLITSNNLTQHIKTGSAKDELTKLSQTFNNLLDRLKESFGIQRNFISNASHELSTPLTSISSQLEVALQRHRTADEYREVMHSIYEDIRELQQLTHSLLDIAKAGTQGSIDLAEVRLDEILLKVISDVQKQNSAYKVVLNFEVFPDDEQLVTAFGNAGLFYIAFKNIIENGCKYADNQQSVVTAIFEKKKIIVKVSNKGDVIAESDIQNIFQPFFRTHSAQQKQGFGLGLTLTRRILSLHKGTIEVDSDTEKGTVFTITLPNILSLS